ncbi:hypothetical protein DSL92_04310 [Billgrantia gudaonensis]|uniref:Uncharacterized protein n=1 Tax=Billgrantia gudaonensis TaxID=376427 RepID=A0A432JJG2_9GAMM|nr:hypothetical protein DSL92_04310 [Halomonas gudaonensis]
MNPVGMESGWLQHTPPLAEEKAPRGALLEHERVTGTRLPCRGRGCVSQRLVRSAGGTFTDQLLGVVDPGALVGALCRCLRREGGRYLEASLLGLTQTDRGWRVETGCRHRGGTGWWSRSAPGGVVAENPRLSSAHLRQARLPHVFSVAAERPYWLIGWLMSKSATFCAHVSRHSLDDRCRARTSRRPTAPWLTGHRRGPGAATLSARRVSMTSHERRSAPPAGHETGDRSGCASRWTLPLGMDIRASPSVRLPVACWRR